MASATINNALEIVAECPANEAGPTITVPRAAKVIGVTVICTASNGSGTITVGKGGAGAITAALACATGNAVATATTLDQTRVSLAAGDTLTITKNGVLDAGTVVIRLSALGASLTVA